MLNDMLTQHKNILNYINQNAENIKENDLDWIAEEFVDFYEPNLNRLVNKAYGDHNNSISKLAFKQQSKEELKKAIYTYLFTSKHWVSGRDINSYLLTVLNRLADRLKWDVESAKKVNIPVCPGCKFLGSKEYLSSDGKMLRCAQCTHLVNRYQDSVDNKEAISQDIDTKISLCKSFALHSRKGYRCPDCSKFIPASLTNNKSISCPYSDCFFFGDVSSLDMMAHPLGLKIRNDVSLSSPIKKFSSDKDAGSLQDLVKSNNLNIDKELEIKQDCNKEYLVLKEVIKTQMDRLKTKTSRSTYIQKTLMYQAYLIMLENYPEEMVSYLVHMKRCGDFPIQAKIFQEYVKLIENAMPLQINKSGELIDILSLTDPNLCLFTGVSKFTAIVDKHNCIPNNTIETYTGGRKMKYRGPCFIGKLIEVKNLKDNTLLNDSVKQYSFSQIEMSQDIEPGTAVEVTHFRMLPHYEIGGLVCLQRTRRKIVDSVYLRIHGKKREITRGQKKESELEE